MSHPRPVAYAASGLSPSIAAFNDVPMARCTSIRSLINKGTPYCTHQPMRKMVAVTKFSRLIGDLLRLSCDLEELSSQLGQDSEPGEWLTSPVSTSFSLTCTRVTPPFRLYIDQYISGIIRFERSTPPRVTRSSPATHQCYMYYIKSQTAN